MTGALTPSPAITLNGTKLTKGTDYTLSYSNSINVGTGKVTIKGKGNFKGKKVVKFRIK